MDRSLPSHSRRAARRGVWRTLRPWPLLALAGVVGLGLPQSSRPRAIEGGQRRIQMPGRAPLSFADIVDRVKPAVVSIYVTNGGGQPKIAQAPKGSPKGAPLAARICSRACPTIIRSTSSSRTCRRSGADGGQGAPRPTQAQGSGFVVSRGRLRRTNNHVIDGGGKIQVSFDKDNKFDAELIGTDQRTDIALLKIKASRDLPVREVRREARRALVTG